MDADRLDALARALAAAGQRRTLLRLLAGGAFGLTLWQQVEPAQLVAAKSCKKLKDRKKRKKCQKKAREKNAGVSPPLPPPPPAPVPVLTYQCPGPEDSGLGIGAAGTTRIAQTFTATQSGSLLQIQFEVSHVGGTSGNYVVELLEVGADEKPTNTVLATATIPNGSVPDGDSPLTASFASGPQLTAGTEYAAALSRPGGNHLQVLKRGGDDCPGKAFTQNPNGSGPFNERLGDDFITSVTVFV